jgi:hypothetical protein
MRGLAHFVTSSRVGQRGTRSMNKQEKKLANRATDITKPLRGGDTKACHTMDQGSTNDKGNQMDEV